MWICKIFSRQSVSDLANPNKLHEVKFRQLNKLRDFNKWICILGNHVALFLPHSSLLIQFLAAAHPLLLGLENLNPGVPLPQTPFNLLFWADEIPCYILVLRRERRKKHHYFVALGYTQFSILRALMSRKAAYKCLE